MPNQYGVLAGKHQQEVNDFPFFFAFSEKQFAEGMASFGLSPEQTDQIYSLRGAGGFYLRSDAERLHAMFDRHHEEHQAAIAADTKGDGYIYDMFYYELANHEYGYTGEIEDTLNALGITMDDVNADKRFQRALKKAMQKIEKQTQPAY